MTTSENIFEAGLRIVALRAGLKQAEFAERLGVHRNSVVNWETGKRLPDGESLVRMAAEFGADISYILTGAMSSSPTPTLPPDEVALLENYRHSPSDGRERIRQISITAAQSDKRKKA